MATPVIDLTAGLVPKEQAAAAPPATAAPQGAPQPAPAGAPAPATGAIDLSAGLVPSAKNGGPPPPKKRPEDTDQGVMHGIWASTFKPLWDEAKHKQEEMDAAPFNQKLELAVKNSLEMSPPALGYKMVAGLLRGAYSEGKKAVQHGKATFDAAEYTGEALGGGDTKRAAAGAKKIVGEGMQAVGHAGAALIPAFGPAASHAAETAVDKPKEGAGEIIGTVGQILAPEAASGVLGKMGVAAKTSAAATAERAALEEAATTARTSATEAEGAAKSAGVEATEAAKNAPAKAAAENAATQTNARKTIVDTARSSAESAIEEMNKTRAPQISDTEHFQKALQEVGQGKQMNELPVAEQSKVMQRAQQLKDGAFKPVDAKGLSKEVTSFGEAADVVQDQAREVYAKLDKVSNGEFANLREMIKANKQAMYDNPGSMEAKHAATINQSLEKEMGKLFEKHGAEVSPGDLTAATRAWRTSKVLEEVHAAVERSVKGAPENIAASSGAAREIQGAGLSKRLNKVLENIPQKELESVLGKDGVTNLYRVAEATATPAKAAKFSEAAQNVARELEARAKQAKSQASIAEEKAAAGSKPPETTGKTIAKALGRKSLAGAVGGVIGQKTGIGASTGAAIGVIADETISRVYNAAVSSPRVGKMLADALSVGASAKVYAPLIAAYIRSMDAGKDEQKKSQGKK